MGKRTWQDDAELFKPKAVIENSFVINFEDYEKLHKLYKFKKPVTGKYFIDPKRNKTVAIVKKELINPENYVIYFNRDWLYQEALATKSETVINIIKSYPELNYMYKEIQKIFEERNKRFKKWIESYKLVEDFNEDESEVI
ncbi:MAG: hypothetical protein IKT40_01025 [Bacilli bacterium]|nr:hypothetical protein [Bacilli bacterium]